MVQVITVYPGRAPEEVERQVTIPIEIAMRTVPKVEVIRSRTIFGLSVVQLIFEEGTENYWARARVQEPTAERPTPHLFSKSHRQPDYQAGAGINTEMAWKCLATSMPIP